MGIPRIEPLDLHATLPSGPRNLITDVAGVRVGHVTIQQGEVNTGVTAVLPHPGNLFLDKVMASAAVINGFGKSAGILQVQELGTIETPILLTNTLSVGTAFTGLCRYVLEQNAGAGVYTGSVNCLVTAASTTFRASMSGRSTSSRPSPPPGRPLRRGPWAAAPACAAWV